MTWHAALSLDYRYEGCRTLAHHQHSGPLRILKSLYPEGQDICHNVLVHPPGGLVGGDVMDMALTVGEGAHGLITTPGATRFYKSEAGLATQQVHAQIQNGARLEWLPLEALAYNQCDALNRAVFELAPQAEMMAWDITALGLPATGAPFVQGRFRQHLEIPGVWLEKGTLQGSDTRLMDSPLGLAGQRCLATLIFASGAPMGAERLAKGLEIARSCVQSHPLQTRAGVTAPNPQVMVLRVLAPVTEPAMQLLKQVWAAWRGVMWQLSATRPRLWNL